MKLSLLFIFALFCSSIVGQNQILLNQYSKNLFALSPAASALEDRTEANLYYKKLWPGFQDSPELFQFTLSGPQKSKKTGLGINAAIRQAGIMSFINFSGSFAYKLKLNDNHALSFGLQAGIKRMQINFSKINAADMTEFSGLPQQQGSTVPDLAISAAYRTRGLYVFFSANQITGGKFYYKEPSAQNLFNSQVVPYYIAGARWTKAIAPGWGNTLCVVLRSHQGLPVQPELSDIITWQNKLSAGIGYRFSYSGFALLRVRVSDDLLVGYSYEFNLNHYNNAVRGGHEINLNYVFGKHVASVSSKKPNNNAINEIYEDIDRVEQKTDETKKRVDTLDKNVQKLNEEMKEVKQKSLDQNELKMLLDSLNSGDPGNDNNSPDNKHSTIKGSKKYGSIVNEEDADRYKALAGAGYNTVYGVFRVYNNAKHYVKLLQRDHNIQTEMIQLPGMKGEYYYVVDKYHPATTAEALQVLKKTRQDLDKKPEPITNGQVWTLIIINK